MSQNRLVIFVKAPLIGRAKTRLAADIGRVHAWRVYRRMTAEILRKVKSDKWETILAVTPGRLAYAIPLWDGFEQYAQVSGSLTPRLAQAFDRPGKTVVIGSDCPQVSRVDIDQAFSAISPRRTVFGPATDGGFWLMGAMGPLPDFVFENVRWSTEHTLADITRNFGIPPVRLRPLTDVDNLAALKAARS